MAKSTNTSSNGPDADKPAEAEQRDIEDAVVLSDEAEVAETAAPQPVQVIHETTVQKVGLGPLVAGGAIAAGIGFLGAWIGIGERGMPDLSGQLAEQAAQITALEAEVAALPPLPEIPPATDLAPLEAAIEGLRSEASTQFAAFGETLGSLEERVTAVERAPTAEGGVSDIAIASIERELDGLRSEIGAQQTRIQDMADAAAADLAAAQAQTAAVEAEARAAAEAAAAEAQAALVATALAEVRVAMESGEPFSQALSDLQATGVSIPAALGDVAEEGVASVPDLSAAFPDLARQALAVARSEGLADQDSGGLSSFLRNQFDVRSTEPREGDDPDAVLSRAEAALQSGDLETTLTEINALPDPVKSGFGDWLSAVNARNAALAAAASLVPSVSN